MEGARRERRGIHTYTRKKTRRKTKGENLVRGMRKNESKGEKE